MRKKLELVKLKQSNIALSILLSVEIGGTAFFSIVNNKNLST